jgi:carboxypeptidase Taq
MDSIGIDKTRCTLAETEHPFTSGVNTDDVRITTHYHENDVASSMFSVIHEGGHAIYDMGYDPRYNGTSLAGGVAMSIHESQSRFYENLLGRSRTFIHYIFPKLKEIYPSLEAYTAEDVYRAVNRAQPSLIRIEADEVTYSLHVMVRYELEKALFDGKITSKELPAEWNRLYKEYLGIDVPDDTRGVLQDSHWAGGLFGYFPSYALGSAYGAQLLERMKTEFDVFGEVEKGNMEPVRQWLSERIWQHGSLYTPAVLMENAFGGSFDASYYVKYLTEKFTEIYSL